MIDLTGQTIAQHEILERLGCGGMADVYKAFHPALAMYRAVKVIRPEFVDDENFRERFQREAQAVEIGDRLISERELDPAAKPVGLQVVLDGLPGRQLRCGGRLRCVGGNIETSKILSAS